jgi:hypothetical protein
MVRVTAAQHFRLGKCRSIVTARVNLSAETHENGSYETTRLAVRMSRPSVVRKEACSADKATGTSSRWRDRRWAPRPLRPGRR